MYLRARYYNPSIGRFLTRDTWQGRPTSPSFLNKWGYVAGNPVNFIDPSGHIAIDEVGDAEQIVNELHRYLIFVEKDWGRLPIPVPVPPGMPDPEEGKLCGWNPGRWSLIELAIIKYGVELLNTKMNGQIRQFVGYVTISKIPNACGRGCMHPASFFRPARIDLRDKGVPPASNAVPNHLIISNEINFDVWTVVHELSHAWDAHYRWRLSEGLESYTGGHTLPGHNPKDCDAEARLPGCNQAGYYYGGTPPKGSGDKSNRVEDFAESVTAYVFPVEAQGQVRRYLNTEHQPYLYYSDYTKTPRWDYVNGLISGTIRP